MARQIRLFQPVTFRGVTCRNRIFVSPMCQYSAVDGVPNPWHLVHLGSRAVGGAGMVCVEATGVSAEGRISAGDTGLWNDAQAAAFQPITTFIRQHGSVAGIQLAHAGRKASTRPPWEGGGVVPISSGGWQTIAPTPVAFQEGDPAPREMTPADIQRVVEEFADTARRSVDAGFEVLEVHMAHGYLLHQFLSPLVNQRTDQYGGSFENRVRFPLEVLKAVRSAVAEAVPVFVRISATDWVEGGWDLEQSVEFARMLKQEGADLIDCSSGGAVPGAKIPVGAGYQVPFAAAIRERAQIATGAVGLIVQAFQAEHILATAQADVVFLARELLRDPYWPLHAARQLGAQAEWPVQYERAKD